MPFGILLFIPVGMFLLIHPMRHAAADQQKEQQDAINADRAGQVGTGDRSEKIRTYNFPQDRCTDHRIGLTLYRLEAILNGDLDELIDALITADTAEKLRSTDD